MPNLVNPYRFGTWTPANLSGIAAWLRADDLDGQADASAVSAWADRVAAYSFAQGTGTMQPTFYKTTTAKKIGGQSAVWFDGGDYLRYAGIIGSPTSGYVIAVCRMDALPAGNSVIVGSADEGSTVRQCETLVRTSAGVTNVRNIQEDNGGVDILTGNTALAISTDYVWEWASSGTAYAFRVNNVDQTLTVNSGANNGDWFGDTTLRDNVSLGARRNSGTSAGSLHYAGGVAEVIIVNDASITAGERTSLNSYLNGRYGITL